MAKKKTSAQAASKAKKPTRRRAKAAKKSPGKSSASAAGTRAAKKAPKKALKKASRPAARARKLKTPLTAAQLKQFRQMLLEKRRSIIGDMTEMQNEALRTNRKNGSGDLSLMPDHPANIASDNYEQEFMLGLLESERALLVEINEALERIEDKTYGICLGTSKRIGMARLRARPWAKYCIEYARMVEKGLVRPGRDDLPD